MYDEKNLQPPCDACDVELDESSFKVFEMYALVRNQVRISGMGDIVALDHKAVLDDIKLYVDAEDVKAMFERVLEWFYVEQEFV